MQRLHSYFVDRISPEPNTGCWLWDGCVADTGYGVAIFHQNRFGAHRLVYELTKGRVPKGLDLDHLCRQRSCVNPDHLEPVTRKENLRRGIGVGPANAARKAMLAQRTHCKYGHAYADHGYLHKRRNKPASRECGVCHRLRRAR